MWNGRVCAQLAERCRRVTALDLSPEMIRVARERSRQLENLQFELADAMTWDFPKSQFDFVCTIATLHHLDQRELLPKVKDALTPQGILVILDLVQSSSVGERMLDVIGFGVSSGLRLIHNGRLQPPPAIRKAWEQHGKHDHYLTIQQMCALANEILPGSSVKRHLCGATHSSTKSRCIKNRRIYLQPCRRRRRVCRSRRRRH